MVLTQPLESASHPMAWMRAMDKDYWDDRAHGSQAVSVRRFPTEKAKASIPHDALK
jgi:hypothetical protein